MEDTQDLIFEIEGNVGSVGSSDLLGVVSLVMTGGTEALHLGKTSDSFEQQTGKKAKTVSRSLARTTTNIWETGNKKILRQVYSNHLPVERPTPKNFIIRLAEYLKRQTIRKQDTPLNGLERNETIPKEPNVHQTDGGHSCGAGAGNRSKHHTGQNGHNAQTSGHVADK